MAKKLTWEFDLSCAARGSCGTHVYRIKDEGAGPLLLTDNQNGWDCFSALVESVKEGQKVAQDHFDNLIAEMAQEREDWNHGR